MRKREIFTLSALSFSVGVIFGFLISPTKNGFGNNAGNQIHNYYDKKPCTNEEEAKKDIKDEVSKRRRTTD